AQGQYRYTYDDDFSLTGMNLVSGSDAVNMALTYDRDGLLTGVGPFSLARGGPLGIPTRISDGTLSSALGYDALGRPTSRTDLVNGEQVYGVQLSYDSAGRIARQVETVAGATRTYDYQYDAGGQLTQVSRDGTVVERYTYDANGNRTSRQFEGGSGET